MSVPAVRAAPPLAPGTRPVPGYEVLAHLARTGWLDVYDVWSEEGDCRCVIKAVRPDRRDQEQLRDQLLREGRWLGAFTHPHLVRAYETFESPVPLVVLETLTGETLSHLLHRFGAGRPPPTWRFWVRLSTAIHYLHGQGLLHLDLKPSNVVVDCGHAKVLDLSIARPPGPAPAGVGTFCYLAPEQARGGPLSAAADGMGHRHHVVRGRRRGRAVRPRGFPRGSSPWGERERALRRQRHGRPGRLVSAAGRHRPAGRLAAASARGARGGRRRLPSDRSVVPALGCRTGRLTRRDAARSGAPHRPPLRPWRGASSRASTGLEVAGGEDGAVGGGQAGAGERRGVDRGRRAPVTTSVAQGEGAHADRGAVRALQEADHLAAVRSADGGKVKTVM
ncbi:Serine/threonine-protein kinase PknD [Streptomyces hirsutus]